jgi:hypothetical protein
MHGSVPVVTRIYYLMTLLVSGLYSIDDRLTDECGADGEMRISIYNRTHSRFITNPA